MPEKENRDDILSLFEGLNLSQTRELRREILSEALPIMRRMRQRILDRAEAENVRECQLDSETK